jgi:hypothetical protein
MAQGATPVLAASGEPKSKIRDIEPLLKWAAVAYGGGFLTVMLHTHRLGVPVVQLIEPIYIWVGFPLALVLYFIGQLITVFQRIRERLRDDLDEAKELYKALQADITAPEASDELIRFLRGMGTALAFPWFILSEVVIEGLMRRFKKIIGRQFVQKDEAHAKKAASRVFRVITVVIVVYRFVLRVLILALIPLACGVYMWLVYPIIPQSLGGGKPSQVWLIVNTKKIPTDDVALQSLFPVATSEKGANQRQGVESTTAEGRTTCKVALQYQTEHAYYVKRGTGPIIVIGGDAVEGAVFAGSEAERQGCT